MHLGFYESQFFTGAVETFNLQDVPQSSIKNGTERTVFLLPAENKIIGIEHKTKSEEYMQMYFDVANMLNIMLPNSFPQVFESENKIGKGDTGKYSQVQAELVTGKFPEDDDPKYKSAIRRVESELQKIGYKQYLWLDPHPKNWMWDGQDLVYLDKPQVATSGFWDIYTEEGETIGNYKFLFQERKSKGNDGKNVFDEEVLRSHLSTFSEEKRKKVLELYEDYKKNLQIVSSR